MSVCYFLGDDFIYGVRYNSDITTDIRFSNESRHFAGCSVSRQKDMCSMVSPYKTASTLRLEVLSSSMFLLDNDGKSSMFARLRDFLFYGVVSEANGKLAYKTKDIMLTPEQVFKAVLGEISKSVTGSIILYKAFFIIPDYYDQEKRRMVSRCLSSVFNNSNILLVNYSSAVGLLVSEVISYDTYCLSLCFDSGPFGVSVLKVSSDRAIPLATLSNDRVTGSDMICELLYLLEEEVSKMGTMTEYQDEPTPEKQAYRRAMYWRLLRYFAYNNDTNAELYLVDENSIIPQPEDLAKAFSKLFDELKSTIQNCCILAGVNLAKISEVVVTGPFCKSVSFAPLLKEMGYTGKVTVLNEKDLCRKVVLHGKCIQVLQSAFSVSLNNTMKLLVDRFTPYPLKKQRQLIVDVEKRELSLTLLVYENRIGDRHNRLIQTFTLNNVAVYQGKISLNLLLEIDESGIARLTVTEINENVVLVKALCLAKVWSVCFILLFTEQTETFLLEIMVFYANGWGNGIGFILDQ